MIDIRDGEQGDNRLLPHVAEEGDFLPELLRHGIVAATDDDIRLDSDGAQFLYAVLCRLGLEFLGGGEIREKGYMDIKDIFRADVGTKLSYGL